MPEFVTTPGVGLVPFTAEEVANAQRQARAEVEASILAQTPEPLKRRRRAAAALEKLAGILGVEVPRDAVADLEEFGVRCLEAWASRELADKTR